MRILTFDKFFETNSVDDGIIGKTTTGKVIYDSFDNPSHNDFTSQEHNQASELHFSLASKTDKAEEIENHLSQATKHANASFSKPQTIEWDTIKDIENIFPEDYDEHSDGSEDTSQLDN